LFSLDFPRKELIMARRIRTVVVFGDSLSDIGKKWTTKSGRMARLVNEMYVSPTGRFSDCRNWTDFMFEEAGGASLVGTTAEGSYQRSQQHMSLSAASRVDLGADSFSYLNYAEGGACADTPREKGPFLGTFKDQVDAFEGEFKTGGRGIGPILFIVWFGANDLYTANRPSHEMGLVADAEANVQRNRLKVMVRAEDPDPKFIFVNLARPLTAVRYSMRLETAKQKFVTAFRTEAQRHPQREMAERGLYKKVMGAPSLRMLRTAAWTVDDALTNHWAQKELAALIAQVEELKKLEQGVMLFNLELARLARQHGDRVAELGCCLSEDSLERLVNGSYRLRSGAAAAATKTHISAQAYDQRTQAAPLTTIDQVHPTDAMYRLIWQEIRREILAADCTFGRLPGVATPATLSTLAGPSAATQAGFNSVMQELLSKRARTP
jgi:hypothetical protein